MCLIKLNSFTVLKGLKPSNSVKFNNLYTCLNIYKMINYIGVYSKVGNVMKSPFATSDKKLQILMMLAGAIGGTIAGDIVGTNVKTLDFFSKAYTLGTTSPLVFNMKIFTLTFGLNFNINLMTIIGLILAIILFRK